MTLSFTNDVIPNLSQGDITFGCIQTKTDIRKYRNDISDLKKCILCGTSLFPTIKSDEMGCPICSPDKDYSNDIFKLKDESKNDLNYFIALDVMIPYDKIKQILVNFVDIMEEDEKVLIIMVLDRIITLTVEDNILFFRSFRKDKPILFLNKKTITDIVLPSLSSIYSLVESLPESISYLNVIRIALMLSKDTPFIMYVFTYRLQSKVFIDESSELSRQLRENRSTVHFGTDDEHMRYISVIHTTFGSVFGITNFIPSFFRRLKYNVISKFELIAPRSVDIVKVAGVNGVLNVSPHVTRLMLTQIQGAAIKMTYNNISNHNNKKVNIIEYFESQKGTFVKCHQFYECSSIDEYNKTEDVEIRNSLLIKLYASSVLRKTFEGGDFASLVKTEMDEQIKVIKQSTFLRKIGVNINRDCYKLYHCLITPDICQSDDKLVKMNGTYVLISFPTVYVLDERKKRPKIDLDRNMYYIPDIKYVELEQAFKLLCQKHGLEKPKS